MSKKTDNVIPQFESRSYRESYRNSINFNKDDMSIASNFSILSGDLKVIKLIN